MNPKLATFILGMRRDSPKFEWTPQQWHSDLAKHIPAPAVYGLFSDAIYDGSTVTIMNPFAKIHQFETGVKKALGDHVRIEVGR